MEKEGEHRRTGWIEAGGGSKVRCRQATRGYRNRARVGSPGNVIAHPFHLVPDYLPSRRSTHSGSDEPPSPCQRPGRFPLETSGDGCRLRKRETKGWTKRKGGWVPVAGRNIIPGRGEGSGRHATDRPRFHPLGNARLEEVGGGQQVASGLSRTVLCSGLLTLVSPFSSFLFLFLEGRQCQWEAPIDRKISFAHRLRFAKTIVAQSVDLYSLLGCRRSFAFKIFLRALVFSYMLVSCVCQTRRKYASQLRYFLTKYLRRGYSIKRKGTRRSTLARKSLEAVDQSRNRDFSVRRRSGNHWETINLVAAIFSHLRSPTNCGRSRDTGVRVVARVEGQSLNTGKGRRT